MALWRSCGVRLAIALAWLGAVEIHGDPVVMSRRHQSFHDQQTAELESMAVKYDSEALRGPCAATECPTIEREVPIAAFSGALRKYAPEDWVYVTSDTWKFKHPMAVDFRMALDEIIKFQRGGNYLGRHISVTTPLLVEVTTTHQQPGDSRPMEFEQGMKLYFFLPSEYQDDPYVEPTDLKMHMTQFTPHEGHDWVAVHQWKTIPYVIATEVDGEWVRTEYPEDDKKVILKHATWFANHLHEAMVQAGAPGKTVDKMYFAAYGHELNRVNELWIPVQGDHLLSL